MLLRIKGYVRLDNNKNIELFDNYGVLCIENTNVYFDIDDLSIIKSRNWHIDKDGYLVHSYFYFGQIRFVRFHRLIMNVERMQIVDHINRNRADNRKSNLRVCERTENDRNRGLYATNTSGITGIHYDKKRSKWVASITYNCKRLFIGRFDYKEEAVKARLTKEVELFKDFAPQRALLEAYN